MIDLLPGIQTVLQARLTYVRSGDIILTGFADLPPDDCMLPAVGIKDGEARHEELAGGMIRYYKRVRIIIWAGVLKERESLIGNASATGILEIENDINTALDENTLGDATIKSALLVSPVPESTPVTDGKRDLQRKELAYEYVQETTRPSAART